MNDQLRALITEAYAETVKGKFKAAVNRLNEYIFRQMLNLNNYLVLNFN